MALWKPFSKKKKLDESDSQSFSQTQPDDEAPSDQSAKQAIEKADIEKADNNQPVSARETNKEQIETPATEISAEEPQAEEPKKKGILGRFRRALVKTKEILNTDIRDLVGKEGRIVDDEFIEELFADLVKTDMGNGPARQICDDIKTKFRARKLFMSDLVGSAKTTIREIMKQENAEINMAESGPTVIMVCGVNGSGKTTSIAKLAHRFTNEGKSVVLGAGDTFRAAAVEQLSIWADRLGCEIVTGKQGSDPASVAYRAVEAAVNNNHQICIVDTAGRLQTQANLMDELSKIRRVMGRVIEGSPHEVLLVLDATAGQNAISQARGFSEVAECTGIVLAKLDGSAKGGVVIPIHREFGLPVKFIGLGETPDALAEFDVDRYVDALFDQDIVLK